MPFLKLNLNALLLPFFKANAAAIRSGAASAAFVTAVQRGIAAGRLLKFLYKKLLINAYIDDLPRKCFIIRQPPVSVKSRVYAAAFKRIEPSLHIKAFTPPAKARAPFKGLINHRAQAAVTLCEYGL